MSILRFFLLALAMSGVSIALASCESKQKGSHPAPSTTLASVQSVKAVRVVSQMLDMTLRLPAELEPYEAVAIYPKVTGFVQWIGVDRGSRVSAEQLIMRLEAPEVSAQTAEAQAKLQSTASQLTATEAKLAADQSMYRNLKEASRTPGVVAGNDLMLAEKAAEEDRAQVGAARENVAAAEQALQSLREVQAYLSVKAPFDGVVTERNVHPGALVGPSGSSGTSGPMLRIETLSKLRLIVPVPEKYVAEIPQGATVHFSAPPFPGQTFSGTVARIAHDVDVRTRTMPIELDVMNPSGALSPGTFCDVLWPVRRAHATLFVPASAIARTLQRVFVVRIRNGRTEWADVKTGESSGDQTEIFGNLHAGDLVAARGTDELKPGTLVQIQAVSSKTQKES
jgi:RND family efflux transporter MFP subunit